MNSRVMEQAVCAARSCGTAAELGDYFDKREWAQPIREDFQKRHKGRI